MSTTKLIDVVTQLEVYDAESTIYAVQPWTCDSEAVVVREPPQGGVPPEATSRSAAYLIEVFIAREFLEGWTISEERSVSVREQCERLIRYAVDDA